MILQRHFSLAALSVVVVLTTSGCAGSTQTAKPSARSVEPVPELRLSRAQLIARADRICARINAKREYATIQSLQDYQRHKLPLAAYERAELNKLDGLVPPASMEAKWQSILVAARAVADSNALSAEDVGAHRLAAARKAIEAGEAALSQETVAALRAGFDNCSRRETSSAGG